MSKIFEKIAEATRPLSEKEKQIEVLDAKIKRMEYEVAYRHGSDTVINALLAVSKITKEEANTLRASVNEILNK
jgi:hypothetical protein